MINGGGGGEPRTWAPRGISKQKEGEMGERSEEEGSKAGD